MPLSRWLAALLLSCVLVPTLAAARPACCVKRPPCCASMTAAATKSCCKAPAAPKPEPGAKDGLQALPLLAVSHVAAVRTAVLMRSGAAAILEARLDHRAASPDDSPPDLLRLHAALLI